MKVYVVNAVLYDYSGCDSCISERFLMNVFASKEGAESYVSGLKPKLHYDDYEIEEKEVVQ